MCSCTKTPFDFVGLSKLVERREEQPLQALHPLRREVAPAYRPIRLRLVPDCARDRKRLYEQRHDCTVQSLEPFAPVRLAGLALALEADPRTNPGQAKSGSR